MVLSADFRGASLESILRTELDPYDLSIRAFKHSGYGNGVKIPRSQTFIFNASSSPAMPKRKDPPGAITCVQPCIIAEYIGLFFLDGDPLKKLIPSISRAIGFPARVVDYQFFAKSGLVPGCRDVKVARNAKEDIA